MEISTEKTKLMTNNTSAINTEIKVNGPKFEPLSSFKYLGSVVTDEGSKSEILSRIVQTTEALARLTLVWNDRSISLSSKIRQTCSFVTFIFLFACESWILTAELAKKCTRLGNDVLLQNYKYLIQRPCYQRRSPCQDPAGNQTR